jgi:hypothetical protein
MQWERLRHFLIHTDEHRDIDISFSSVKEEHHLEIDIHVRESDEIRTQEWWDETYPTLFMNLKSILPTVDFSNYHRIYHDPTHCPVGDINSMRSKNVTYKNASHAKTKY